MIREAMRYIDPFEDLRTIVQVREPHGLVWETIAAFNNQDVAKAYAIRCARGHNTMWAYQVLEWCDGFWLGKFSVNGQVMPNDVPV